MLCDTSPWIDGHWSDSANAVCAGTPSGEQRRIFDRVRRALELAIRLCRPGALACDVDAAVRAELADLGPTYGHHTGHGIGASWSEPPRITPYERIRLEEGMVLAVEPAFYAAGFGGIRLEHVFVVRAGRQRDPHQIRAHAVKVALVEPIVVNVPYRHREVSSIIARDGVTDILVRITTDDGLVGWGEATSGADAASIEAAVHAMAPFVSGAIPGTPTRCAPTRSATGSGSSARDRQLRLGGHRHGARRHLRQGRRPAALAPARRRGAQRRDLLLLPRPRRRRRSARAGRTGLAAGYDVFYLKVGLDDRDDLRMVATLRDALGDGPKLRLDVNSNWSVAQALRMLEQLAEYDIDFVEQPVRETPLGQLGEVRRRSPVAVCSNEGLWSEADAYARIRHARPTSTASRPPGWARWARSRDSPTWPNSRASRSVIVGHAGQGLGRVPPAAQHRLRR